ncbi:microviridin/marinostatin family tricyclic proteinase inhibitor [Chamaesiphon minutus]|uniref:Serine endopeptidase inhibitor n=1 Tax=Chamaesiphon minutus (strain ATCC 27169 / PCC 6605) TaxID=1173020 RepID=K9UBA9_CHAP6|nr:microviridin/marinostatin family tricyclic proteinase inhibitor [Chamaesiphon minutus]AFY92125.1 Serine endopeptidase inhibitor [Chamaesiphon minutus PCC 6605]
MKASSIKFSLSTLTLLSLAAVAATPTLATSLQVAENTPSQIQTNDSAEKNLPFFARFLEGQHPEVVDNKVALTESSTIQTQPLNSLSDLGKKGTVTTRKYPSDAEDNTGGGTVSTMKYPSDAEDNTGGIITTKKYPSDAEDNTGGNLYRRHRR